MGYVPTKTHLVGTESEKLVNSKLPRAGRRHGMFRRLKTDLRERSSDFRRTTDAEYASHSQHDRAKSFVVLVRPWSIQVQVSLWTEEEEAVHLYRSASRHVSTMKRVDQDRGES